MNRIIRLVQRDHQTATSGKLARVAAEPREGVQFSPGRAQRGRGLPGWGTKIFTRPSRARARKPTSVATADVYPTECNEGVYPEERSEDFYPTEQSEGAVAD